MFDNWDIQQLRGVGNVEVRFCREKHARVLFGSNGVGKTKCLEAIFQALLLSNKTFASEFSRYGHDPGWESASSISADAREIFKSSGEWQPFSAYSNGFQHETPIVFLGASGRSRIPGIDRHVELIGTFSERRTKYLSSVFSSVTQKAMSDIGMTENARSWFISRASSVNPYQKGSDNRSVEIEAVLQILHSIDGRIDPDKLQVDGGGHVSVLVDGVYRELQQLSSGFASLIRLVQAIVSGYANFTNESNLTHVSGMVIIDEIESHLHAEWQSKIIPILKNRLPNTIFFIATHSPIVLSQLEQGEAYLLQRDRDGVVRTSEIDSPNKRSFVDVLESGFNVDLNALKRESMLTDDQSAAKNKLLDLLKGQGS